MGERDQNIVSQASLDLTVKPIAASASCYPKTFPYYKKKKNTPNKTETLIQMCSNGGDDITPGLNT